MKALFKIYTIQKKSNCVEIKKSIKLINLRKLELMAEDFRVESIVTWKSILQFILLIMSFVGEFNHA